MEHPVINDTQRALWGALGISSWPTQVVVSPAGKVLFSVAGEGHAQDIEDCAGAALEYYAEAGALRNDPLPLVCVVLTLLDMMMLYFPSQISLTYHFCSEGIRINSSNGVCDVRTN